MVQGVSGLDRPHGKCRVPGKRPKLHRRRLRRRVDTPVNPKCTASGAPFGARGPGSPRGTGSAYCVEQEREEQAIEKEPARKPAWAAVRRSGRLRQRRASESGAAGAVGWRRSRRAVDGRTPSRSDRQRPGTLATSHLDGCGSGSPTCTDGWQGPALWSLNPYRFGRLFMNSVLAGSVHGRPLGRVRSPGD